MEFVKKITFVVLVLVISLSLFDIQSFDAYTKVYDAPWWVTSGNYEKENYGSYNYRHEYGGKDGFKYGASSNGGDLVANTKYTASGKNVCVSSWVKNAGGSVKYDTSYNCGGSGNSYTSIGALRGSDYASVNVYER